MAKVKVGLIGLGIFFHKMHLPMLSKLRHRFEVTSVYTSSTEKFLRLQKIFPKIQRAQSINQLFSGKESNAIVACVPIPQNVAMAEKAIRFNKYLLLEKPLAHNLKRANEIVQRGQKRIMVAESFCYFEAFRKLKRIIRDESFGKLEFVHVHAIKKFDQKNPYYQTTWRRVHKGYSGILWDAGIHVTSLLRFLFGQFSVAHRVLKSHNPKIGQHDTLIAHLNFPQNVPGSLVMSYSLFGKEDYFLTVYFSQGRIKCHMNSLVIESKNSSKEYSFKEEVYEKIYDDYYYWVAHHRSPSYGLNDAYQDLVALNALISK